MRLSASTPLSPTAHLLSDRLSRLSQPHLAEKLEDGVAPAGPAGELTASKLAVLMRLMTAAHASGDRVVICAQCAAHSHSNAWILAPHRHFTSHSPLGAAVAAVLRAMQNATCVSIVYPEHLLDVLTPR